MTKILIRFVVGGAVVSLFALTGDVLKPKSLAGLLGAAPSVALATLGLTIATKSASYAAIKARSMIAGAVAFFLYASCVSWVLMHRPFKSLGVALAAMPLWFAVSLPLLGWG